MAVQQLLQNFYREMNTDLELIVPHWAPHKQVVHKLIQSAGVFSGDFTTNVLVIGAGNGHDLPLPEIASRPLLKLNKNSMRGYSSGRK
ncbi:hypothetical protein ACFPYJ_12830 [Paenibacillus solisilvae]|uniref:Class I SAM-dependent methyltransferase n=1 Tax=Paenibacillus solisilvae TaxID=2486751 RepID=A0ABW0VX00_9BACL